MSDASQGEGWWQASDDQWYPPETHPSYRPPPPLPQVVPSAEPDVPPGLSTTQPPSNTTNGLAIASLVLGILWLFGLGSILALIFGFIARQQIRTRHQNGNGLSIAGIVLGFVGVGLLIIVIIGAATRPTPLTLQTSDSTPQLATLQGTSCARDGSNANASGTIHNVTVAPMTVTIFVATGTQAKETAQTTVKVTFSGGVLNASNLPWQASLPANGASTCFVILTAQVDLP
jgi:hypothetical protein